MNKLPEKILIIAESGDDRPMPAAFESISCAGEIKKLTNADILTVVIGRRPEKASQMIAMTGSDVFTIKVGPENENYPLFQRRLLKQAVDELKPDLIITGHTSSGIDMLPGLAVEIGAACITGVKKIGRDDNGLLLVRPVWNGKFDAAVRSQKAVTAITVQPGAYPPAAQNAERKGTITGLNYPDASGDPRIRIEGIENKSSPDSSFDDADVIVSAGRGIGKEEHLETVKQFAALLQKSAIGGSRPLIDCGWLPYRSQIGVTGKTVAPKIYIACGISGSSQHIAGMAGSETIISINTDPGAAIFNISDYSVIEDAVPFLELLVKEIQGADVSN